MQTITYEKIIYKTPYKNICNDPMACPNYHCDKIHSLLRNLIICENPITCTMYHCDMIHSNNRNMKNTACFLGPFCKHENCPNKK